MKFDISVFGYVFTFLFGVLFEHFIRRRERYRERVYDKVSEAVSNVRSSLARLFDHTSEAVRLNRKDPAAVMELIDLYDKFKDSIIDNIVYLPSNIYRECERIIDELDLIYFSSALRPEQIDGLAQKIKYGYADFTFLCRDEVGMTELGDDFSGLFLSLNKRIRRWLKKRR